jgi:hypothetical protein
MAGRQFSDRELAGGKQIGRISSEELQLPIGVKGLAIRVEWWN